MGRWWGARTPTATARPPSRTWSQERTRASWSSTRDAHRRQRLVRRQTKPCGTQGGPAPPARLAAPSVGDLGLGHHVAGSQAHQKLAGYGVAATVRLGGFGPHVAAADPGGPDEQLVGIFADLDLSFNDHERKRGAFVVDAETHSRVAPDRAAFQRFRTGGEHDRSVLVEVEPDRGDVGTPVLPDRGQLPGVGRLSGEKSLPLLFAHDAHRGILSSGCGQTRTALELPGRCDDRGGEMPARLTAQAV